MDGSLRSTFWMFKRNSNHHRDSKVKALKRLIRCVVVGFLKFFFFNPKNPGGLLSHRREEFSWLTIEVRLLVLLGRSFMWFGVLIGFSVFHASDSRFCNERRAILLSNGFLLWLDTLGQGRGVARETLWLAIGATLM